MAGSAGSIYVDLLLRDAKYTQGLSRAQSNTQKTFRTIKRSSDELFGSFNKLGTSIAAFVSAGTFVAVTRSALSAADNLVKLSESLGVSTTNLQKYQYAANAAGLEADTLQTALAKLNSNIADGNLPYKTTSDALQDIADKVQNASTNIERARIVNEAFGAKLGSKLIPFLLQGSEGIKKLGDEAQKFGAVLDEKTIKSADEFGDQMTNLATVIKGNFQQGLLSQFADESGKVRDIFSDPKFQEGIKAIGEEIGKLVKFLTELVAYIGQHKDEFEILAKIAGGAYLGGKIGKGPGALIGGAFGAGSAGKDYLEKNVYEPNGIGTSNIKAWENGLFDRIDNYLGTGKKTKEVYGPMEPYGPQMPDNIGEEVKKTIELVATKKELKAANDDLKKEEQRLSQLYGKNIEFIDGLTDSQRNYSIAVNELDELLMKGKLTQDQYTEALGRAAEKFDETNKEMTVYAEQAARNIQDAFGEFLFDPFADGLDGMLLGFVNTLRKMLAQQVASQFLGADQSGGGFLGGLVKQAGGWLSGVFSGANADGGFIPPGHWGIAGEAGAEAIYGGKTGATVIPQGGGGGNVYNIDARGADQGAVVRLEQALMALAGPGRIQTRVGEAQKRGEL